MVLVASAFLLSASATAEAPGCVRVIRPVPRGAAIVAVDLGQVAACPAKVDATIRFDRATSTVQARRDLVAGDVVPALGGSILPVIRKGDSLFLRSRVGAITVERPATALQTGSAGRRIFAVTVDGQVLSALVGEETP